MRTKKHSLECTAPGIFQIDYLYLLFSPKNQRANAWFAAPHGVPQFDYNRIEVIFSFVILSL